VDGGGGGLVTLVTPLVKEVTFPSTLEAKFWTPPTTEAANAEPGKLGNETFPPPKEGIELPEETLEVDTELVRG
jgi:hypothetical protein